MLEVPYEMLIASEMLNTQIKYNKTASESMTYSEPATEGLGDPDMRAVLGASMKYVAASATRNMRKSLRCFIEELKNMINDNLKKMLIKIGVDDTYCLDRANVTDFLVHNWDRIISIQRSINTELRIIKRGSMMKKSNMEELDLKIKMLAADFERWKKHTEPKKVQVRDVKDTVSRFKDMVSELNVSMKDLEIIETRLEYMQDVPQEIGQTISTLITTMSCAANVYTTLINSLEGSIEPLSRILQNASEFAKYMNPMNHYDDDVDLKVLR